MMIKYLSSILKWLCLKWKWGDDFGDICQEFYDCSTKRGLDLG